MSLIERYNGRRHAAQLLQDGAELQSLLESAALHPIHFRQGMMDVLGNKEVMDLLLKKRDATWPKETRQKPAGYAKQLPCGNYESYVVLENGREILIGVFPDRHRARHARDNYNIPPKLAYPYPGIIEHFGGFIVRRRFKGKEYRCPMVRTYEEAIEEWKRIDEQIQRDKICGSGQGNTYAGAESVVTPTV